jgi:hypothetical protein
VRRILSATLANEKGTQSVFEIEDCARVLFTEVVQLTSDDHPTRNGASGEASFSRGPDCEKSVGPQEEERGACLGRQDRGRTADGADRGSPMEQGYDGIEGCGAIGRDWDGLCR